MLEYGYGGRVLRANLSTNEFEIENLEKNWIEDAIGGRAANVKRLYEELDSECDPLGPKNMLLFGVGPLTGSPLPASSYYIVSTKSPLTGILGNSAAGGQFGAAMKQAGLDQIIITGKTDKLGYLKINDSEVELRDCHDLAGKTVLETTKKIREKERDHSIQIAAIGKAGENQVLFSSIISSGNRANGRTGIGAVMGSKNLKAIALTGSRPVKIFKPTKFQQETQDIKKSIKEHGEYKARYKMGTTMLIKNLNELGILPTKHFQCGVFDYADEISGELLADEYKVKNKSCFNCNVHCSRYCVAGDVAVEGPEYETLCSFTSKVGISDLEFALEMTNYLNQVGMDSISTSEVIAWLMECQEKGLIDPKEVGGLEIKWGDKEKVRDVVKKIANRDGIGDELAKGATKFSQKFGEEAKELVMQVKGLDVICGDPRGIKAYGLTYAVASRGADHLFAEPFFELTGDPNDAAERFGSPMAADRLAEEGKAELVTYSEKIALLTDCMTMCKNIGLCMDILDFEKSSELLKYGTGINYSSERLRKILRKGIEREYKLNKKFGIKRDEDVLPKRFLEEPLRKGPVKGETVDIEKMVDEYYDLHGRNG